LGAIERFTSAVSPETRPGWFDDSAIYGEITQPHAEREIPCSDDARKKRWQLFGLGGNPAENSILSFMLRKVALILPFEERKLIDRYFKLNRTRTTIRQEMLGGLTRCTMAYVIIVNPGSFRMRGCRWKALYLPHASRQPWQRW